MKQKRHRTCLRLWTEITVGFGLAIGMPFQAQVQAQSSDVVVYLDSTRQLIRGFGAANIRAWRPDMTADNIQKAFGTGDGELGFSILRLRLPPTTEEFAMNVPTAQAASAMGVTIFASPWSPPASMKTNNDIVGGRLADTSYASFAAYMHSFVDFMASNGVPIYAVSVQNEPDITVTYESCDWNTAEMVKFVKEQGQAVGTKLIAPESFQFLRPISDAILNDSAATANVSIIGGHIYGGGLASYPLAASKGKELWMTEHLELDTSWTAVLATGREIHDCMNAGMNAYIWWYIVRFYGPIHEDGYVTKRGYVMSQFSRFIRPGFTRVQAYNPRGSAPVTAYRRNSEFVIVAVNAGASMQQTFRLENVQIPVDSGVSVSVTPYVTSPTKNRVQGTTITGSPSGFSVTLDSSSVTTLVGTVVTGTSDNESDLPRSIELGQNYPNPFNPSTMIRFAIPTASSVTLAVFDVLGRHVTTLVEGEREAGIHVAEWNPSAVASGLYFYRLAVESIGGDGSKHIETKSMMLIR